MVRRLSLNKASFTKSQVCLLNMLGTEVALVFTVKTNFKKKKQPRGGLFYKICQLLRKHSK